MTEEQAVKMVDPGPKYPSLLRRAVAVGFAFSGAAALIYEVTWTRELSLVFGSTVYAVSMMLTAFMAGLSIGGVVGGRLADRQTGDLVATFAWIELLIGAFGLTTIPLFQVLPVLYFRANQALHLAGAAFFLLQLVFAFLVMVVPTTLMGANFPVASKISTWSYSHLGRSIGDIYSINTVGSIAGSFVSGFVLIPFLGVRATLFVAAGLNFIVALAILFMGRRSRLTKAAGTVLAVILFAALTSLSLPRPTTTLGFGMMPRFGDYNEFSKAMAGSKMLFREENAYSRVTVFQSRYGDRSLHNGGFIEGSQAKTDTLTQLCLAALPAAFVPDAKKVAVIGLGTGYTVQEMLGYPLQKVETIEINPAVPKAARYFVGDKTLRDPRHSIIVDDARSYIRNTSETFDIISSEPSWPLSSAVTPLFTQEYYRDASKHLSANGVYCQWLPQYLLEPEDFQMMYKTFHSGFRTVSVWQSALNGKAQPDILMIGTNAASLRDEDAVAKAVAARFKSLGHPDMSVVPMDAPRTLAAAEAPNVPVNTDDRNRLEFAVVRNVVNIISAN